MRKKYVQLKCKCQKIQACLICAVQLPHYAGNIVSIEFSSFSAFKSAKGSSFED
jgi:hypothetical protein